MSGLVFYVRKEDRRELPDLSLPDAYGNSIQPSAYRLDCHNAKNTEDAILHINDSLGHAVSNMAIHEPEEGKEFPYDQLRDAAKTLSQAQMITLHGRCMAKHWKQCDKFEKTFLKVYKDLKEADLLAKSIRNHPHHLQRL